MSNRSCSLWSYRITQINRKYKIKNVLACGGAIRDVILGGYVDIISIGIKIEKHCPHNHTIFSD